VSAPVTHLVVLFTSSATVIQFAVLGQLLVGHSAWFGALCLVVGPGGTCFFFCPNVLCFIPQIQPTMLGTCPIMHNYAD